MRTSLCISEECPKTETDYSISCDAKVALIWRFLVILADNVKPLDVKKLLREVNVYYWLFSHNTMDKSSGRTSPLMISSSSES